MAQLFILILVIGACLFICGFAGYLFKGDKKADAEYAKAHQEFGSALFALIKPFLALAITAVIAVIIAACIIFK